jgi:hypothetical protein
VGAHAPVSRPKSDALTSDGGSVLIASARVSAECSAWFGAENCGGKEGMRVKISRRKVLASMFAGLALAVTIGPAFGDAGGGPGSNNGCAGHQPPPPPSGGCGH